MSRLESMMSAAIAEEGADASPVNDEPSSASVDAALSATDGSVTKTDDPAAAAAKALAAEQEAAGKKPDAKTETDDEKAAREKAEAAAKKPEPTKEEKASASRFAALARQKDALETERTSFRQQQTQFESQQAQFRTDYERANQEVITAREQIATQRAAIEKVLDDPDLFFQALSDRHGIKTTDDLKTYANKAWSAPPKAAPAEPAKVDPKDRPMTRAELDAWQAEQAQLATSKANVAKERADFLTLTESDKYEAAAIVFSEDERYAHAAKIAKAAFDAKEPYSLANLADAVNELAKNSSRWQRVQKRGPQPTTAAGKPGTDTAAAQAATQPNDPPGRQPNQASRALANDAATERASAGNAVIPTTTAERKAAREARKARLLAS